MNKTKKVLPLSELSEKILALLTEKGSLTVADMKTLGIEANSSNLTALKNRGLVESETVVIEVPTITKRKVQLYSLIVDKE